VKRAALLAALSVLLLPVLVLGAAAGGSGLQTAPSGVALADIPPGYLALYQQAGQRYGLPWELLAAVGKVECDHGRLPHQACTVEGAENEAGAGGPMQFLASTWAAYGVDADGDGRASRWSAADAIFAAGNYLRASGAPGDVRAALFAYNHSAAYVEQVLAWTERYRASAQVALGAPGFLAATVLAHPNVALRPQAAADVRAGRVDPRVLAVLLALAEDFRLGSVGPFVTGHGEFVAGTDRRSNHFFGRAVDIGAINGQLVSPRNGAAEAAARATAKLPPELRPDEIGTPFPELDRLPGFFSDDAHADHLHLGYDG
jgi:hypothetical protein